MKTYLKWNVLLTLAGTLFAGYLSAVKLFSGTCALNESCPYFLGYPACFFGFLLFAVMFVATLYAQFKGVKKIWPVQLNAIVSTMGILFAGYFTVTEISSWIAAREMTRYTMGLPTCTYGLVFYIIIYIYSLKTLKGSPKKWWNIFDKWLK